mgnify:CR=1 FL=1
MSEQRIGADCRICGRRNIEHANGQCPPPIFPKVQPLRQKRHDLQALVDDIKGVVHKRDGTISVTEAIGALEIAKLEIFQAQGGGK